MALFPSVSVHYKSIFQCVINTHVVIGYGTIDTVQAIHFHTDGRIKVRSVLNGARYNIHPLDVVVPNAADLPPLPLHFGVRYPCSGN